MVANPQGNEQPAAVTRGYRPEGYESEASYRTRLVADLKTSRQRLRDHAGVDARALAWPYGEYNDLALEAAEAAGFTTTFSLTEGVNLRDAPMRNLRRYLIQGNHRLSDVARMLNATTVDSSRTSGTLRSLSVSLDDIDGVQPNAASHDASSASAAIRTEPVALSARRDQRLGDLIERVTTLGVNLVVLPG